MLQIWATGFYKTSFPLSTPLLCLLSDSFPNCGMRGLGLVLGRAMLRVSPFGIVGLQRVSCLHCALAFDPLGC
jgi:hypothetical protein